MEFLKIKGVVEDGQAKGSQKQANKDILKSKCKSSSWK